MIKLFRENITDWFADWEFYRPVFFTGVLNNTLGYGDGEFNYNLIRKNNKHFLNDLHRKVYKKSKKKLIYHSGVSENSLFVTKKTSVRYIYFNVKIIFNILMSA